MRVAFQSLSGYFPKTLSKPLLAAVVFSSAVHAAIAFTVSDAAPLNDQRDMRAASSQGRSLHVLLAQRTTTPATMSQQVVASFQKTAASPTASSVPVVRRMNSGSKLPLQGSAQGPRDAVATISEEAPGPHADQTSEAVTRPTPLTYPILVLPPGDDPHRIGMVRLLLVVSSDGKVVNAIVSASTMSQDYIDLVTKSFEDMRFKPGLSRGAPHPGWYDVVVNFDFEPPPATSL